MTVPAVRHLVTVWNPSYAANAMDEHLRVLRNWAQRYDAEEADDESLYVWWGKVKSSNRQQPMTHLDEVHAVADASSGGQEVHLYLTDYRALYVAEIIGVSRAGLAAEETQHVPAYYADNELRSDLWFKLGDIRRLVADDTLAVVEELQKLRNVHYADRPVSIYGGMVNLPLVVSRPDGRRFFDQDEREALVGDRLWAEFDAEAGSGVGAMERELRENRFGDTLWMALDPAARTFVATGERLFREHRGDAAFDFAPVLGSFAKAVEVQANVILQGALPKLSKPARLANLNGRTVDLSSAGMLGLGELARAIGGERELNTQLARALDHGQWFTGIFPAIADALREVRNPGAHTAVIDRTTATMWRARLLGVGCEGDLVALARVRVTARGTG